MSEEVTKKMADVKVTEIPESEMTEEQKAKKAKQDAKKAAKAAEKAAKAAKKEANRLARLAATQIVAPEIKITPEGAIEGGPYGEFVRLQSVGKTGREFVQVSTLNESHADQEVWIRARIHNTRGAGNSVFWVVRQTFSSIQALCFAAGDNKPMIKWLNSLPAEALVDIHGKLAKPLNPVTSCTQQDIELHIQKCYMIAKPTMLLPFSLEDASRPDEPAKEGEKKVEEAKEAKEAKEGEAGPIGPRVGQDTRLDNRALDLRTPANQAILRIQSMVGCLFREFLTKEGFVEIHTPKLLGAASEGGADVFEVKYFDRKAYLAQSPQLYKQMAIVADMDRVFEVGSVFRAEQSYTARHLTEFIGLDIEMAIDDHYHEVLEVLDRMFRFIFEGLNERCAAEIAAVHKQYPTTPLRWNKESTPILKFPEAIEMLRAAGVKIENELDDLDTPSEKKLGEIVAEKYGVDFYILDRFPTDARAFYSMPSADDPRYSNSFDLFIRGQEITSGAQRIHEPELLVERAKAKGVDPISSIQPYVDAFKLAAKPHGGAGIGLERVVRFFLGLDNIRKTSMFPRDPSRLNP